MKLKPKIYIVAVFGIAFTVAISMHLLKVTIIGYIEKNEINSVLDNYNRSDALIGRETELFENTVTDWAQWDDSYRFVKDLNREFIVKNLQDNTFKTLNINLLVYLNSQGSIVFSKQYDVDGLLHEDLSGDLHRQLNSSKRLKELLKAKKPVSGVMMLSGKPVLVAIAGVTDSKASVPADGLLIVARYIDDKSVKYISSILNLYVGLEDVNTPNLEGMEYKGEGIWIKKSNDVVYSYSAINDIFGIKALLLELRMERRDFKEGLEVLKFLGYLALISWLVISVVCIQFVNNATVRRLNKLLTFMEKVGEKRDTKERLYLKGKDEIASIAMQMNKMLERIDGYYNDIRIGEERFRLVMEAANDGYFDSNLMTRELYVSNEWIEKLELEENKNINTYEKYLEIVHPQDLQIFKKALTDCLQGETEQMKVEYRILKPSGEWLWVLVRAKVVEYDDKRTPLRLVGTIQDISERKKYEEENIYLSQTDVVTALKNRTYMEELLRKADKCEKCNSWIVMGDVNGLKIVNDSLGHQKGDKLLRMVGDILRDVCAEDDIPARWGGDEFVILINNKDFLYVQSLICNIRSKCSSVGDYPVKISISLGCAQKDSRLPTMKSVLKAAEEIMYRNKLLESQSTRSSILASLEQSLHEKHIETEEHTRRIEQTCLKIGYKMGLPQAELDELALLGLLHDIGKIGIPEHVLLKPGKLTDGEWEIMKTHSEIGYRIASATPELAHIAEGILSHHERYDGLGYPRGFKGNEIPKLSRLLSIVDSFDVMTHDRHYKKAISLDDAINELKRCSGKQFDPDMVEMLLELLREDTMGDD